MATCPALPSCPAAQRKPGARAQVRLWRPGRGGGRAVSPALGSVGAAGRARESEGEREEEAGILSVDCVKAVLKTWYWDLQMGGVGRGGAAREDRCAAS